MRPQCYYLETYWGYLSEASIPRISTLDILSQYVGYTDWASFMEHVVPNLALHESQDAETVSVRPASQPNTHSYLRLGGGIFAVLLIAFAAVFYFWGRPSFSETEESKPKPSASKYILTIGLKFKSHQENLKFFGILNAKVLYGQQIKLKNANDIIFSHFMISIFGENAAFTKKVP